MCAYQVLARKFRPRYFRDVVAQEPLVTTLKNAIRMERSAHAYLFCGCRGTGKTTLARLFAKALNCPHLSEEIEPCGTCPSCCDIASGNSLDVLEIDGASHRGIEDIRQINETIGFAPLGKRFKIYLIDEVHMLTKEAFNALLKSLEEPPAPVKFFFCTTEPHKLPATILSRCQRFNLRRIPRGLMVEKMQQISEQSGVVVAQEALEILAELSEGSLRDALSLLDQVIAFERDQITPEAVRACLGLPTKELFFPLAQAGVERQWGVAFKLAEETILSGKNLSCFLEELTSHFRTLLLLKNGVAPPERFKKQYEEAALHYRIDQLIHILELLMEAHISIKTAPSERTALEMLLLKILQSHQRLSLEQLVQRLIILEKQLSEVKEEEPKIEVVEQPPPPIEAVVRTVESPPAPPVAAPSLQEQSRFDTVMHFAAKELNGSLQ